MAGSVVDVEKPIVVVSGDEEEAEDIEVEAAVSRAVEEEAED